MRKVVACLALAGALATVHCSSDQGSLRLGLYVNDLVIPDDTNLMGLYLAELDDAGRTVKAHSFEAAPLREGGVTKIPFPASLVLVSGETTTRVHARLVAFSVGADGARTPLTMREARTVVPTNEARLVRLQLFWHGTGNVVDDQPGVALGDAAAAFSRLHSLCNGARAGVDVTAGIDQTCVPIEVASEADVVGDPLPGSAPNDACFDVAAAFAGAAEISLASREALPAERCSVQIPAEWRSRPFHVGVRGASGFASGASFVRPLPLGGGAVLVGDRLELAPVACAALASGSELVLAASGAPWKGENGVCSDWNSAKRQGVDAEPGPDASVRPDATVPDPRDASDARESSVPGDEQEAGPEGGADASDGGLDAAEAGVSVVPSESSYTLTDTLDNQLLGLAVAAGDLVLTLKFGGSSALMKLKAFTNDGGSEPLVRTSTGGVAFRPRAVVLGGATEFLLEPVEDPTAPVSYLRPDLQQSVLDAPNNDRVRVAQIGANVALIHGMGTTTEGRLLGAGQPPTVGAVNVVDGSLLPRGAVWSSSTRLVAGANPPTQELELYDCLVAGTQIGSCVTVLFVPEVSGDTLGTIDDVVDSGLGPYALVTTNNSGNYLIAPVPARGDEYDGSGIDVPLSTHVIIGGPERVCVATSTPDQGQILCASAVTTNAAGLVPVFDSFVTHLVLASDDTYLYAAYRCLSTAADPKAVHLRRIRWSTVETNQPVPALCN